jgi:hydrogenase/urease accessory protein HupE
MPRLVAKIILSLTVILFVFPSPAYAHPIDGSGFISSLTHFIFEFDHLPTILIIVIGVLIGLKALRFSIRRRLN